MYFFNLLRGMSKRRMSVVLCALTLSMQLFMACSDDDVPQDVEAPGEVSGVTVEPGDGELILTWTNPTEEDFAGVEITFTPGESATALVLPVSATSTLLSDLENDVEYTITIKAVDEAGNLSAGVMVTGMPVAPIGVVFFDDFEETCIDDENGPATWVTYSVSSDENWECRLEDDFGNNATINGFGADAPSEDWLISPAVTLEEGHEFEFSFIYDLSFEDVEGFGLSVWISTDYSGAGDPTAATWTELEAGVANVEDQDFAASTPVSLASYSGNIYIGFKYTTSGTEAGQVVRVNLDNVRIGLPAGDILPPESVDDLAASLGNGSVLLQWEAPEDTDLAGYIITYTPEDGEIVINDPLAISAEITGLTNGTTYTFSVSAFDTSGNESQPETVSATPIDAVFLESFGECDEDETPAGWVVYSEASEENWICDDYAVEINGYGADEASVDWLISPAISLPDGNNYSFVFDYYVRFTDIEGYGLALKISTDYSGSGDPTAATWTTLDAGIDNGLDDGDFVTSDAVSLASYSGDVYFAFYYTSSGTESDAVTGVAVDNVAVAAN